MGEGHLNCSVLDAKINISFAVCLTKNSHVFLGIVQGKNFHTYFYEINLSAGELKIFTSAIARSVFQHAGFLCTSAVIKVIFEISSKRGKLKRQLHILIEFFFFNNIYKQ